MLHRSSALNDVQVSEHLHFIRWKNYRRHPPVLIWPGECQHANKLVVVFYRY